MRKRGKSELIDDGCLIYENKLATEGVVNESSDLVEVENIEIENNYDEQSRKLKKLNLPS